MATIAAAAIVAGVSGLNRNQYAGRQEAKVVALF